MSFLETFDATPADQRLGLLIQALRDNPLPVFAELRGERPILGVPPNFVFVSLRRDVQDALGHNSVFTVAANVRSMDPVIGPFMLARDDTVYNQRDKCIMRALTQQSDLPLVRREVARLARAAIEVGADGDSLDVTARVTRRVPIQLTGSYFGFPGPDEATMAHWSRATQTDMFYNLQADPEIHQASVVAGDEMKEHLRRFLPTQLEAIDEERAPDTVVTRLLRMVLPREIGFDMKRVLANTMGMLIGGIETTSAATTQALSELLDRPEQLADALGAARAGDDERFDGFIWEALRFDPQAPFLLRLAASDYLLGAGTDHATTVEAGSIVLLSHASAMLDESIAADAGEFNPERPRWWFMHMGYGPHRCLGDQVSLQQVPEIAKQILLAGFTRKAGSIDFDGGVFPERFTLLRG